jgi:hypothetical protein
MLLPLIIGAILVFVAFTFGRPYVMQFLASVPVPEEHRRLFSAVSYGFIFTVVASLIFTLVGVGGYSLFSFALVWGLLSVFEYISPTNR